MGVLVRQVKTPTEVRRVRESGRRRGKKRRERAHGRLRK
jgi:hypothetical protein